jgi:hypothetical protein
MKYPVFKRRLMAFDMENYYAVNTDVWVFGSSQHYKTFSDLLTADGGPKTIVADPGRGMDLLILPPATEVRKDFMVIHERLVYQAARFNMELIIGGSQAGLQVLAKYFDDAATKGADLHYHQHVNDMEKLVVLPSVFLNIQGPLDDIENKLQDIAPPAEQDLLPDMKWRDDPTLWPHTVLTYRDLHGRLPIKKGHRTS